MTSQPTQPLHSDALLPTSPENTQTHRQACDNAARKHTMYEQYHTQPLPLTGLACSSHPHQLYWFYTMQLTNHTSESVVKVRAQWVGHCSAVQPVSLLFLHLDAHKTHGFMNNIVQWLYVVYGWQTNKKSRRTTAEHCN